MVRFGGTVGGRCCHRNGIGRGDGVYGYGERADYETAGDGVGDGGNDDCGVVGGGRRWGLGRSGLAVNQGVEADLTN